MASPAMPSRGHLRALNQQPEADALKAKAEAAKSEAAPDNFVEPFLGK